MILESQQSLQLSLGAWGLAVSREVNTAPVTALRRLAKPVRAPDPARGTGYLSTAGAVAEASPCLCLAWGMKVLLAAVGVVVIGAELHRPSGLVSLACYRSFCSRGARGQQCWVVPYISPAERPTCAALPTSLLSGSRVGSLAVCSGPCSLRAMLESSSAGSRAGSLFTLEL